MNTGQSGYNLVYLHIILQSQSKLKLIQSITSIIENSNTKYDEVWCVFDMDVNQGEKEFADFDNAIKQGKSLF